MMFANKFVLSVKANHKILRENQGVVTLPFGQEFSLLCKNLNSRRAMVSISVDGVDATDGKLIIEPNGSIDLERFIRNGNLNSGNRFKFIERTAGVEAHRGIGADDGLIRAEFWAEKEMGEDGMTVKDLADALDVRVKDVIGYLLTKGIFATVGKLLDAATVKDVAKNVHTYVAGTKMPYHYSEPWYPNPWIFSKKPHWGYNSSFHPNGGSMGPSSEPSTSARSRRTRFGGIQGQSINSSINVNYSSLGGEQERSGGIENLMHSYNDAGITVPGSESNQQFQHVKGFPLESSSTVIVLQLRGEVGGVAVSVPVTVDRKPTCSTCGKVNKAQNKFCAECGTALFLI